jgi:RNA polymerase primary sigma factor
MAKMRQLRISQENLTDVNDTMLKYFIDIRKIKTLSPEEEYRIAVRAAEGDERAKEALINANLRFVISVAKQYASAPLQVSELIAEGNIGLIEAAGLFDPHTGFKFISFAVWHIRKRIYEYLSNKSKTVRLPLNVSKDARLVKERASYLSQLEGRDVTTEEALEALHDVSHITTSAPVLNTGYIQSGRSTPFESDEEDTFSPSNWVHNGESTEDYSALKERNKVIWVALNHIDSVGRDIVVSRLGLLNDVPESYDSIAKRYGRSSEWSRLNYTKALRKLKKIQILQSQL